MVAVFEPGSIISDRYIISDYPIENINGDQVYPAVDDILNREVGIFLPAISRSKEFLANAKNFAKDSIERNNEINILDIRNHEAHQFLVTTHAEPEDILKYFERNFNNIISPKNSRNTSSNATKRNSKFPTTKQSSKNLDDIFGQFESDDLNKQAWKTRRGHHEKQTRNVTPAIDPITSSIPVVPASDVSHIPAEALDTQEEPDALDEILSSTKPHNYSDKSSIPPVESLGGQINKNYSQDTSDNTAPKPRRKTRRKQKQARDKSTASEIQNSGLQKSTSQTDNQQLRSKTSSSRTNSTSKNQKDGVDNFLFDNAATKPKKPLKKNRVIWITAAVLGILLLGFATVCFIMLNNVSQNTFNNRLGKYTQNHQPQEQAVKPVAQNVSESVMGLPEGASDPEKDNTSSLNNIIKDDNSYWTSHDYSSPNFDGMYSFLSLNIGLKDKTKIKEISVKPYQVQGGIFSVYLSDNQKSIQNAKKIGEASFNSPDEITKLNVNEDMETKYVIVTFTQLPTLSNPTNSEQYGIGISRVDIK